MRQFLMVQGTNRSTLFHFSFTALNRETQISSTEKIVINGCLTYIYMYDMHILRDQFHDIHKNSQCRNFISYARDFFGA